LGSWLRWDKISKGTPNSPVLSKWLTRVPQPTQLAAMQRNVAWWNRTFGKILFVLKFVIRVKAKTPVTLSQVSSMSGRLCRRPFFCNRDVLAHCQGFTIYPRGCSRMSTRRPKRQSLAPSESQYRTQAAPRSLGEASRNISAVASQNM